MNAVARYFPLPVSEAPAIPTKAYALAEALNWVRHWQRDQECGLAPTAGSLARIEGILAAATHAE